MKASCDLNFFFGKIGIGIAIAISILALHFRAIKIQGSYKIASCEVSYDR